MWTGRTGMEKSWSGIQESRSVEWILMHFAWCFLKDQFQWVPGRGQFPYPLWLLCCWYIPNFSSYLEALKRGCLNFAHPNTSYGWENSWTFHKTREFILFDGFDWPSPRFKPYPHVHWPAQYPHVHWPAHNMAIEHWGPRHWMMEVPCVWCISVILGATRNGMESWQITIFASQLHQIDRLMDR